MAKGMPKPTPPKKKNPTEKYYLPNQGPAVRGNRVRYSTSSAGRFNLPEAQD